jgi:tetratricopeptide (TPR) repeat protein/tRNA A-37 threonylcarbamoyl transferase component Bud32
MLHKTFSHYRVIGELGKGGMGIVYLAEDIVLQRRVAVKFPTASVNRNRLMDEARAASALSHPAIAGIYDCGETDGAPYIVMEYVEGTTLLDEVREHPLPVSRAVRIVAQVLEALAEAHRCRIIHRDIKPANIRIDPRGAVKVLDFGLAKSLGAGEPSGLADTRAETRTAEGVIRGTPQYMSPEQARGENVDEGTDIFAAGIVLYECLTGRSPFAGETAMDGLANVLQRDPPPPSQLNSAVPPALDRVVRRALEKDRTKRYPSAAAMLAELSAAPLETDSMTIVTRPLLRRLRTAPVRWMSAGIAAAVLAMAVFWLAGGLRTHRAGPEVQRWYQEGVTAIRDGTYYTATKMLERSVAQDPGFAPAQARLAEAYNELDDTTRAQQAMLRAMASGVDSLPGNEAQSIRAINRVLTNDFAGAVAIQRSLLDAADAAAKPSLYVDLGRSLERTQNPKDALAAYQEAARLAPDLAAAWMRLGMLSGRRQDSAAAAAALDRAESLYHTLGNIEGLTEVLFQRGSMAADAGKVDEAIPLLERARQMAEAGGNPHQAIVVLFQMSVMDVRKGDIAAAEAHGTLALDSARRNGLELMTARGLITVGNAFLVRGDASKAERYFTQSLDAARRFNARRTEARALLSLGSLHTSSSEFDLAVKEIEQALTFYERGGYERERLLALTLLGRVRRDRGDYAGGAAAFQDLLERARKSGDSAQLALAYEGLGQCASYQERYADALGFFREKTALSLAQGNLHGQAYGILNSAFALGWLGRLDEAAAELARARAIATQPGGSAVLQRHVDLGAAHLALFAGHYAQAASLLRPLTAEPSGLPARDLAELWYSLGLAEVESGAGLRAKESCRKALELAQATKVASRIWWAQLAHAQALLAGGDREAAAGEARQSLAACTASGAKECAAIAALTVARSTADGRIAREFANQAIEGLAALERSVGPGYQQSFQARPDVRLWRRRAQSVAGHTVSR